MPEHPDPTSPDEAVRLSADDPAAPAVEALRALAEIPVAMGAELARFLEDPVGSGAPEPRSNPVTVIRLPIRRAGRTAVAVGAALAFAAVGGVAVAASGGSQDRKPAVVQQDDPSDTTTTTTASETETTATEPTQTEPSESTETSETSDDAEGGQDAPARTANPVASANHHDGQGADDEHADVNGGGEVDHRAEHSPTAHPTGGAQGDDEDNDGQGQDAGRGGSHRR